MIKQVLEWNGELGKQTAWSLDKGLKFEQISGRPTFCEVGCFHFYRDLLSEVQILGWVHCIAV